MQPREKHPNRERIAHEMRKGKPLTKYDLELRCLIALRNVNAYLTLMHREHEIHIAGYRRDTPNGPPTKIWAYGPGKDAVAPPPMTPAQRKKRRKANIEGIIRDTLRKRGKRAIERIQRMARAKSATQQEQLCSMTP